MDDLLAHFVTAGLETCGCCEGRGTHPDGSECDRCDGSGRMHDDDTRRWPYCPGREGDEPAPKRRRHWREPKTAGSWGGRWFHGTDKDYSPGDVIRPGNEVGEHRHGPEADSDHLWVSDDAYRAGSYGHRTYEVVPHSKPKRRHSRSDEHTTTGADVLREVSIDEAREQSPSYQQAARAYERQRRQQHEGARPAVWFAVGHGIAPTAAELFHGSDREEPFSRFDFHQRSLKSEDEEESPLYKQEGEGATTRWWNSRLGSHFTSEHHVASEIAQRMGGHGNVYHAELNQQNPKHYDSEHDLAEEAVGWARKKGYKGLRNLGFSWDQGGWHHAEALQNHPQSQQIAEGFRAHLQSRGHDGITYGNEYEGTKGHLSAIAFHPDQVKITQVHGGYDPCPSEPMQHEAVLHGPDELPPDPGTHPIPEGHVRLWHYTRADNVPSIREHGLLHSYARGDSGTGDLSEPSAGVWASTKRPDDILDDHSSGNAAVVEYHAHPDEISGRAESPWQGKKGGGYDPDKLSEWAKGYHHVIMHGDVKPHQILAIHEGWHGAARYMKHSDPSLKEFQWIHDESAEPWNNHLNPYRRGLQALERERGQQHEASQVSDYGMEDRPDEDGDPLHAMGSKDWPSDFYDRIHEYDFSHGEHGSAHLTQLRRARGDPEKRVRIYRSAPAMNPESRNAKKGEINHGDWVTLNKPYAEEDARGVNERSAEKWKGPDNPGRHHIWSTVVPAKHIRSAGNDLMEWGYWGEDKKDLEHSSERCSHRNPFTKRERAPRRRRFEDTNYSGKQHFGARQREGDEKPFGGYTMRYHQEDQGERRPRHVIETHHPQDGKVGELNWYGTTGVIHNLDVEEDHSRKGIATAMWSWGQEMFPKPRHSGDRTEQGKAWAKSVGGPGLRKAQGVLPMPGMRNPYTGGSDWYHGTRAYPEELSQHHFQDPMEHAPGAFEYPDAEEGGHWNSLLGTHFTADHEVARQFAKGEHSSSANERGGEWDGDDQDRPPHEGVVHARLGLRNPKVYASEHDMDHEAYEHEHAAGNHPSTHLPLDSDDEDDQYENEEMWHNATRVHRDYHDSEIPASTYGYKDTQFEKHPMRTLWLNSHPDKWGIADRFRKRLQDQGHDGIIYGNEYEKSTRGVHANKSAIAFDPGRVQVTQHHHADRPCQSGEEAEHAMGRLPGYGQGELTDERGRAWNRFEAARDISRIRLKHEPPIVSGHWERDEQGVPTNWVDTDPAQGHHMLTALAPNNRTVGWMHWDKGVVRKIDVNDNWKRSGLGRRMWEHASTITPGLSHSDNRTEEGQGFARAVGGPLPERVQDHPEWFREAVRHPYIAPPQAGEETWRHLQEAHGVSGAKTPGTGFMTGLHDQFHSGQVADRRRIPHQHEDPGGSSRIFTPIPPEELEEQRRAVEERRRANQPKPERLDDREYSIRDVSRHYDWEGFDPYEISHLVHHPEHATFTREDVPVHSLRHVDEHGSLRPAPSYSDIAGQDEDEQRRLDELEHGDEHAIPPIVVVRHGEHHIIADGSHRAAIYARHGRTHIPAFVTRRTIFPGQHEAARELKPLRMEPGLYYRSHGKDAPFGPEHASTRNVGEPPHPDLAKYWEPKEGYSAFWNPHHVQQYHHEMSWDDPEELKRTRVIAFRGTPVGEGADGEPRVMPHTARPEESMSWRHFQDRLEVTQNGYGRWNDHTWGDGPQGQQVDDGYRTLGGDWHTAAWQPTQRIFGPTYGLDRRLFTPGEQLKPGVRQALLGRLQGVLEPLLGENWDVVTRAYLAGSEASRWTSPELVGNGDLDVLIGVAYSYARRARPDLGSMTDAEIDQHLNAALQQRFNAPGWHPPFGPEDTYDLTGYVNHNALDIKVIKPYAAYDLTKGEWAVRPPHLPHWSAEQFPQGPALMQQARALIAEVRAILRLPEPFRTQEAGRIWDYIHEGRRQDFTETGLGWQGTGNVLEKALDQASGKLVEKLKSLKYGPADHAPAALGHGMTTADLEPAHA